MKKEKNKKTLAWVLLVTLITLALTLTYIKFFTQSSPDPEEVETNNSSSNAVHTALNDITKNFNKNPLVEEYKRKNITLKASVNNYSIYISYITEETITYEFNYSNLKLSIVLSDEKENFEEFKTIYKTLIEATQERINNKENVNELIDMFFKETPIDGLTKKEVENGVEYQIDITKKIKKMEE